MKILRMKLVEMIKRTPTVKSFRFLPEERMDFVPGQFLKFIFDENNPGNKELNKYLSVSSSPEKEYIELTKRLTGSVFSERLKNLKSGDSILAQGPLGSCTFDESYQKVAFIIGGIGITPVISVIEYLMDAKKYGTDIVLVYSNRSEEEIAFKKELDSWQKENPNLKVLYTVTDCQPNDKNYIFGKINKELLLEKVIDLKERRVFIFGPAKMVEEMHNLVKDIGVAALCIEVQSFVGY
ncbi:MAG: FAD-dependent oxidoreductase [Candidatus Omnitrophota bacterium]